MKDISRRNTLEKAIRKLKLFGSFIFTVEGETPLRKKDGKLVPIIGGDVPVLLLGRLAQLRGRDINRPRLQEQLFPSGVPMMGKDGQIRREIDGREVLRSPKKSAASFRTSLKEINQALTYGSYKSPISAKERNIYFADAKDLEVDTWRFTDLLRDAESYRGGANKRRLEEALALYTGTFLRDINFDPLDASTNGKDDLCEWLIGERRRFWAQACVAYAQLGMHYLADKKLDDAQNCADLLAKLTKSREGEASLFDMCEPDTEDKSDFDSTDYTLAKFGYPISNSIVCEFLMRFEASSGWHPRVLQSYQDYLDAIRFIGDASNQKVTPNPQLETLYKYYKANGSFPTIDCGSASQLPQPRGHLIGLEDVVNEIEDWLLKITEITAPQQQVVNLYGVSGVGKTEAAIAAARRMASSFAKAPIFIAVTRINPPEIFEEIAQQLDIGISLGASTEDAIREYFRSQSDTLLILDQLPAIQEVAAGIEKWLKASPALRVLITSREPIDLPNIRSMEIRTLVLPIKKGHMWDAPENSPAVQLFLEVARQITDRKFNATDLQDIATICDHLNGWRFLIVLYASTLNRIPLPNLVEIMKGNNPEAQWVRDQIETLLKTLNKDEQQCLWCASLFPDHFTAPQINRLMKKWRGHSVFNATATLRTLQAGAMIWPVKGQLEQRTPVFTMMKPVRDYLQFHLAKDTNGALLRMEFARMCQLTAAKLNQDYSQRRITEEVWSQAMRTERGNFIAALDWLLAEEKTDLAAKLATELRSMWEGFGYFSEAKDYLERVLAQNPRSLDRRIELGQWLGKMNTRLGQYAAAHDVIHQAIKDSEKSHQSYAIAYSYQLRGNLALHLGDFDDAKRDYQAALEHYTMLNRLVEIGCMHRNLGNVAFCQDDYRTAKDLYIQAKKIFEKLLNKVQLATTLIGIANVCIEQGPLEDASDDELLPRALQLIRQTNKPESYVLCSMGELECRKGNLELSLEYFHKSLDIFLQAKNLPYVTHVIEGIVRAFAQSKDRSLWARAAKLLGAADEARKDSGFKDYLINKKVHNEMRENLKAKLGDESFDNNYNMGNYSLIKAAENARTWTQEWLDRANAAPATH